MTRYPCANCRRELEVEDPLGGKRVKCPHCGNVEVVPPSPGPPVARPAGPVAPAPPAAPPAAPHVQRPAPLPADRASALGLPPDSGPETEVLRVHPVMFRSHPAVGLLVLLLILGGLALGIAGQFTTAFAGMSVAPYAAYIGAGVLAAGLLWMLWWKLKAMGTRLIITNKRTTVRRGLFGRDTREMLHGGVRDIRIIQTFAQRLMRTGTLGIDGTGTDAVELVVEDLPDPVGLRKTIDAYRDIG